MNEPETKYGVWITNLDGEPDGRWMSDVDSGKRVWSGSFTEATLAANSRRMYRTRKYEVREVNEP